MTGEKAMSRTLKAYILAVAVAAMLVIASLGIDGLNETLPVLALLTVLAAAVGTRSVTLPGLNARLTASDVFTFAAFAAAAPIAAPLVALADVAGALITGAKRPPIFRVIFNLSAVPLAAAAGSSFIRAGRPFCGSAFLCVPLLVVLGAVVCHLANFAMVAAAVGLSHQRESLRSLVAAAPWTLVSSMASALAGLGVATLLDGIGPVGVLVGLVCVPPTLAYFRMQHLAHATQSLQQSS
jgi:hypothetical protein